MARKPTVWFREEDDWFYTTRHGKQVKLSQDKAEARKASHTLMATEEVADKGRRPTVARPADEFLEHSKGENEEKTWLSHRRFLQPFCDSVKGKEAPDIRPDHVTA